MQFNCTTEIRDPQSPTHHGSMSAVSIKELENRASDSPRFLCPPQFHVALYTGLPTRWVGFCGCTACRKRDEAEAKKAAILLGRSIDEIFLDLQMRSLTS